MTTNRSTVGALVLLVGSVALVAGCGGSDGGGTATTTAAPTTVSTTSSTTAPTTAVDGAQTTTSSTPVNTLPVLIPGQPCTPGSDPDCIDPEGIGEYVYLIGGAACMAGPLGGPTCSDLDGDGYAGYPDSG